MDQSNSLNEQYKRIRQAGSFAFGLGIIQLVLFPLLMLTIGQFDLLSTILNTLVAGSLIFFGRKLRTQRDGDIARLGQSQRLCNIILWISGLFIVITTISGGRVGLLLIILILHMTWSKGAIKKIRESQTVPSATPAPVATAASTTAVDPAPSNLPPTGPPSTPLS